MASKKQSPRDVRLYRILNMSAERFGTAFALCDKHAGAQLSSLEGTNTLRECIADCAKIPCSMCEPHGREFLTGESYLKPLSFPPVKKASK